MNTIIVIPDNPKLKGRRFLISQSLRRKGWNVHYLMWDDPFHMNRRQLAKHCITSLRAKNYQYQGLTVHQISRLPCYWPYINGLLFKYQLKKIYKNNDVDIIFTETYTNETEIPKGLPFIYDLADDYRAPADLYGTFLYKIAFWLLDVKGVMKRQCERALAVTSISDLLFDFAKHYNQKIIKLPSGLAVDEITYALNEQKSTVKNPYSLVYVSGFGPWSRIVETMETVQQLKTEFPRLTLTLIGSGSETSNIINFIKKNHAQEYMHYLGYVDDRNAVMSVIANSAIGLNISTKDKFRDAAHPIKVLEYTAMGKKVVSTNLAEVEGLGFSNIFIFNDSNNRSGLKNTLRRALLYENRVDEYEDISKNVLTDYSWDKLTEDLIKLINRVVV